MKARNLVLLFLVSLFPIIAFAQNINDELIAAVKRGDVEAVKSLIVRGANVNTRTNYGATALHFAADRGHLEVIKVLENHRPRLRHRRYERDETEASICSALAIRGESV
jgi:predicted LPLAT superfamily acyltransferase